MDFAIIHGDCLEVMDMIPSGSVDCVLMDPPYGIGFPYLSYDDTRENLVRLIQKVMPECFRVAKRVYVLCGPTQINLYPQADWVSAVVWNTTGSFGKYGYSQWTPVLCYGRDLKGFGNVNGVTKADVLRISGGGGVGFARSEEEKKHTCPKPITVMDICVRRFTESDSVVLDPFAGSGTTGVACMNTGRKFIGIEKEQAYVEIAKKRIEAARATAVTG